MKKFSLFLVCLIILASSLAFITCDDGSKDGQVDDPLIFTGTSGGKTVTIKISQTDPSKAVLTPREGDFYEIRLAGEVISRGTISINGNIWEFNPSSDSPGTKTPFTATYTNNSLFFSGIPGTSIANLTVTVSVTSTIPGVNNGNNGNKPALTGTVTIDN